MKKMIDKYREASQVAQPSVPWLAESLEGIPGSGAGESPAVPRVPRLLEIFSEVLFFLGKLDTSYEDELKRTKRLYRDPDLNRQE